MRLPFTGEQFFGVFRSYNEAVWPVQVALFATALVALALVRIGGRRSGPGISLILALLWLWIGIVYHGLFFAPINPVAYAFAAISVVGAALLIWHGVARRALQFRLRRDVASYAGIALIRYALVVYPAWSIVAGHGYPSMPTFGLPCPTTLFTIGMLAFLSAPYPRAPIVVPVLWCLVGTQAAFLLDVPQDLGLLAAAAVGVGLMLRAKTMPR